MRGYLGNQSRGGGQGGGGQGGGGQGGGGRSNRSNRPRNDNRNGNTNGGRPAHEDYGDLPEGGDDLEIIAPTDLARSRSSMNLTELKKRPISDLVKLAETMGLENMGRSRKQDIIFGVLKAHARKGEDIYGDGVLEILQDGFGFLRSSDSSYLAGPDDIYVQPEPDPALQPAHRRFDLRTDPPAEGRRTLLRAAQGRRDQLRFAGELARQGAVREPDAAASDRAPEARTGQRIDRGPDGARHRSGGADRQGPARPDRLPAEGRQDDAAAEHRHRHHRQPSRSAT